MAAKKTAFENEMVITSEPEKEKEEIPTARIFLPLLEDPGDAGLKVDQFEHVTISNEERTERLVIHRGEWVDIPWYFFVNMKEMYPNH